VSRKNEQILDALEHGFITPKTGEQLNQTIKMHVRLNIDLPMRLMSLVAKVTGRSPIPRAAMVRGMLGLPATPSADDAALLNALPSLEKPAKQLMAAE